MARAKNAGRLGIWGASGTGKTTYLLDRLHGVRRVVVMDVTGDLVREGFQRCNSVEEVRAAIVANWRGFRLAYCATPGQETRCLNQLAQLLSVAQAGYEAEYHDMTLTLAVDEMADAFPATGGLKKVPHYATLCSQGRHKGIALIGCSQRIAEVHTKFRGNCNEAVVFASIEPNDVERSADTLGLRGADRNRVRNLEALHFLHRTGAGAPIDGVVTPGRRKKHKSTLHT